MKFNQKELINVDNFTNRKFEKEEFIIRTILYEKGLVDTYSLAESR